MVAKRKILPCGDLNPSYSTQSLVTILTDLINGESVSAAEVTLYDMYNELKRTAKEVVTVYFKSLSSKN
jgi:hypothetical protein